tara:strand:- start:335 stop:1525 length:1191 start_codon:yes stop_codon:yes gene_type:complete
MSYKWSLINDSITDEDKNSLVEFIQTPNARFTNGKKVKTFEKEWSEWCGVRHSTFVNSGASANYIMASIIRQHLSDKQMKEGPEVIVPALCWVSDVSPLVNLGLTPVFVDVDPRTFSLDTRKTLDAITDKTVGVILVHGLGFNGLTDELLEKLTELRIPLIEDCCESHGATHNGKRIGTFGDMSNFSFYFGHHMTSIEGGTVCTNDEKLDELIKMYRSHGMIRESSDETKKYYERRCPDVNPMFLFAVPGYNLRNNEINAVLASSQLKRLNDNIENRRKNLDIWLDNLSSDLYWTDFKREGNSSFCLPLVLNEKNSNHLKKIIEILDEKNIEYRLGTVGGGNHTRQPYLRDFACSFRIHDNLEVSDHIADFGLYVGNHPELSKEDILDLTVAINKV